LGRDLRDARRRAGSARAEIRRLAPAARRFMQLDPAAYLRLTAPNCLGTSASGAAFATSTGDVLEITCFGAGIFRMRVGPNTKPDYGLVTGRAQRCEIAKAAEGWSFAAGGARLEIAGEPIR